MSEEETSSARLPEPWRVRAWRAFNTWRRRGWPFRVLVLVLIFSPALTDRLFGWPDGIEGLMKIATQAIYMASMPQVRYHLEVYYKAQDAAVLRFLLRRHFDTDGNGSFDAAECERAKKDGFDISQLTVPLPDADLDKLARAAKAAYLVPQSYSAESVRRRDFLAARARAQELVAGWWKPVNAEFAKAGALPDYTKWATWKRGISWFLRGILWNLTDLGVGIWLFFWFLISYAVAALSSRRRLSGSVVGGVGAGAVFALSFWHMSSDIAWGWFENFDVRWVIDVMVFGVTFFGGAVGLWAGGLARKARRPLPAARICAALAGVTLVAVAVPVVRQACESALLLTPVYAYAFGARGGDSGYPPYYAHAFGANVVGVAYLPLLIGALLLAAGVAGLWFLHRRPEPDH